MLKKLVPLRLRDSIRSRVRSMRLTWSLKSRGFFRPRLYSRRTPERVGLVFTAPAKMLVEERLFLYAFVRGLKPRRALEIGVHWGGSACIIAAAMEDNGVGQLVGIDPEPEFLRIDPDKLFGRYTFIAGTSPKDIPEAIDKLGGKLEFALVDGLHTYDAALQDLQGVIPEMAEGGYILMHDALHFGVNAAADQAIEEFPDMHDCGAVCRSSEPDLDPWVCYGGFRLLRVSSAKHDSLSDITTAYELQGRQAPPFDWELVNHGPYNCKYLTPCPRCKRLAEAPVDS